MGNNSLIYPADRAAGFRGINTLGSGVVIQIFCLLPLQQQAKAGARPVLALPKFTEGLSVLSAVPEKLQAVQISSVASA